MFALQTILRLNAASCIGFGVLFAIAPASVAAFLSDDAAPSWLVLALGIGLVLNGVHLLLVSRKAMPAKTEILYFSGGDFIWVLFTVGLVLGGHWVTTTAGVAATLAIAVMVGTFGAVQMTLRKRMGNC